MSPSGVCRTGGMWKGIGNIPSTGKSSNSSSSSSCGADVAGAVAVWEVLAGSASLDWVGCSLAVGAVDMMIAAGCCGGALDGRDRG